MKSSFVKKVLITSLILFLLSIGVAFAKGQQEKAKGKGFEGVTITMATAHGVMANAANLVAPQFEAETGIKVKVAALPYMSLYEKTLTAMIGKTGAYDVVSLDYPWAGAFMSDYMAPLEEFLNNPDLADPDYEITDHIPILLWAYGQWEDVQYALPYWGAAYVLFYRKDLFSESGLKVPTTWNEWEQAARTLTRDTDGDGTIDQWGTAIPAGKNPEIQHAFNDRMWSMGGDWVNRKTWEVTINSPQTLQALRMWIDHIKNFSPPAAIEWAYQETKNAFYSGRSAMITWWSDVGVEAENPDMSKIVGKVGYAPPPRGVREGASSGGWGIGISVDSKEKEASFLWIQYLTNKANDKALFLNPGVGPTRFATHRSPEVKKKFGPEFMEAQLKALGNIFVRPRIAEYTQMREILDVKLSQIILEELTPEKALAALAEEWTNIMKQAGY